MSDIKEYQTKIGGIDYNSILLEKENTVLVALNNDVLLRPVDMPKIVMYYIKLGAEAEKFINNQACKGVFVEEDCADIHDCPLVPICRVKSKMVREGQA